MIAECLPTSPFKDTVEKVTTAATSELERLERVNVAFGKLAPKGTWLCEVMENIYRAASLDEAVKVAEEAAPIIHRLDMWTGDRSV